MSDQMHTAAEAIEAAIEALDQEWETRRGALEEALEIVRSEHPPETRRRLKRRTGEENDKDVLHYLGSVDCGKFTEAEVTHATRVPAGSVQASLGRIKDTFAIVVPTQERAKGRGHVRLSRVWVLKEPVPQRLLDSAEPPAAAAA